MKQSSVSYPENCAILRSDAAWRASTQISGLGWNIKHARGVSTGSTSVTSVISALTGEAMAMRMAIAESKSLGVKKLICESDSALLIKALKDGEVPMELYGVAADILDLAFHFEFISFNWIPREKNSEADLLAKLGLVDGEVLMSIT